MIASWALGLYLAFSGVIDWKADGWFHAKLVLVLLLSAYHGALGQMDQGVCCRSKHPLPRFYRVMNEIPTLLMIGIVILVVVRPF